MAHVTPYNPYGGYTVPVDRMIGDAYPNVKLVADNITGISYIAQNMDAVTYLGENMPYVIELFEKIPIIESAVADAQAAADRAEQAADNAEDAADDAEADADSAYASRVAADNAAITASNAASVAGSIVQLTRTWDRVDLYQWMKDRGYVWGSEQDASPHLNVLLSQAVEGGAMSGRVVIVPPGKLVCKSSLFIQPHTRRLALVGDENVRFEFQFVGQGISHAGGVTGRDLCITDVDGYRPRWIYMHGLELGKPYVPDPEHTDYGLGDSLNGNLIDFSAWDVLIEKFRFYGKGPGRFFHARGGRWDMNDFDCRYATWRMGGSMQLREVTENSDGGWMRFRRGRLRSTDDCLQVNGGFVKNFGVEGYVLFEDIIAIAEKNRGAIIQLGGQHGEILVSTASHGHIIFNRCDIRGGNNDIHIKCTATTGSIAGVVIRDCILRGKRDAQDEIIGDSSGGPDDEPIDEEIVTDESPESLLGQNASIQVIVANHPDRPGPGIGRIVVDNTQIPAPGAAAFAITQITGIGKKVDVEGNPSTTGTLVYYDGSPNTTPSADVVRLDSIRDMISVGSVEIRKSCRFGKPRQWTPTGLQPDNITPRTDLPGHIGFDVVGTNQIALKVVESAYIQRGDGWLHSASRVFFTPAGVNTGAASLQVRSGFPFAPIYRTDGVTLTSGGEVVGGSYGMVGCQLLASRTAWKLMTNAAMVSELTPGVRGTAYVVLRGCLEASVDAYQREPAAGQEAIILGSGVSMVRQAHVSGRDMNLDIGPLHGPGPGSPPCWPANTAPLKVTGVKVDEGDHFIIGEGYSSTPLTSTPHALVRPVEIMLPQTNARRPGGIRIEKADFSAWPNTHLIIEGVGYDIGEGNFWPTGMMPPTTQVFGMAGITGQDKIRYRHATRTLLLTDDVTKTLSTLEPDLNPGGARRLLVVMTAAAGKLTFTEAVNIKGVGAGLTLSGVNKHAEFEYDPVTSIFRLVATNVLSGVFGSGTALSVTPITDQINMTTNCALGNKFTVTLAGTSRNFLNPLNMAPGMELEWKIKQDATGGRNATYGTAFVWPIPGTAPTLNGTPNAVSIIKGITYDGVTIYARMVNAYAA